MKCGAWMIELDRAFTVTRQRAGVRVESITKERQEREARPLERNPVSGGIVLVTAAEAEEEHAAEARWRVHRHAWPEAFDPMHEQSPTVEYRLRCRCGQTWREIRTER